MLRTHPHTESQHLGGYHIHTKPIQSLVWVKCNIIAIVCAIFHIQTKEDESGRGDVDFARSFSPPKNPAPDNPKFISKIS